MQLSSFAFEHEGVIPAQYTCDGQSINPPLLIQDVPYDARSLVLIMEDPDAPSGTFVHWTAWNIDPSTSEIPEDSSPEGAVEGMTSFGEPGYGGPCPPSGVHRYYFYLYALDTSLNLSPDAEADRVREEMTGHVLEESELMGRYSRT